MFDAPFFHFITFFVAVLDQGRERFSSRLFFPLGSRGYVGSDVSHHRFLLRTRCDAGDVTQGTQAGYWPKLVLSVTYCWDFCSHRVSANSGFTTAAFFPLRVRHGAIWHCVCLTCFIS